jgi:hypothetical protein
MPTRHTATITNATSYEREENMSEIQALVNRVQSLNDSVDFWNKWMVWGLLFTAIAAVWVVFATSVTIRKTKELGVARISSPQQKKAS